MMRWLTALAMLTFATTVAADQFKDFGDVEVHYVVVNTLFLQPDVAARYGVVRSSDRAIVNVSVLDQDGVALLGEVTGDTINLMSQRTPARVRDDPGRRGDLLHRADPLHRSRHCCAFDLTVSVPDRAPMKLEFQQTMYVESPR